LELRQNKPKLRSAQGRMKPQTL